MTSPITSQFPDVLGAFTNQVRTNLGVAQVALAVRPQPAPAGRPFEVILLVQNASDQRAEVSALLHMPDQDSKRQKNRFLSRSTRLVAELKAGETGFITMEATSLADTAPGEQYKLTVEIAVKGSEKPRRVRAPEGGPTFQLDLLNDDAKQYAQTLRGLIFSAHKPALRNALEASFAIGTARPLPPRDLKAKWVSLWTLVDADDSLLMDTYADVMTLRVFPHIRRGSIYPPLVEATQVRFTEGGYPLNQTEASLIAKMMMLILEYATPRESAHGYIAAGAYAIAPLLMRSSSKMDAQLQIPHWFRAFLRLLARDERAADHIAHLVTRQLYVPLLRDAIENSFALVQQVTGETLGEPAEISHYADQLIANIEGKSGLTFQRVYLPLIMGGILINDKILNPGEKQDFHVNEMVTILQDKQPNLTDNDVDVVDLTQRLIHRMIKVYGNREV